MPRKSKTRILRDLLTDSYIDSVMIGLSDETNEDMDVFEEVMRPILRDFVSFDTMDGDTFIRYDMPEILRFSFKLSEVFEMEQRVALRVLLSPAYNDAELSDEDLVFIEYLIKSKNFEAKAEDIRRDAEMGMLMVLSVDDEIRALTEKGVINLSDDTVFLIIGTKVSQPSGLVDL